MLRFHKLFDAQSIKPLKDMCVLGKTRSRDASIGARGIRPFGHGRQTICAQQFDSMLFSPALIIFSVPIHQLAVAGVADAGFGSVVLLKAVSGGPRKAADRARSLRLA